MALVLDADAFLADGAALARIGADPAGGITRLGYSPEEGVAHRWVAAALTGLGCRVHVDPAGNLVARYPGRLDLPPLASGSHLDTVPHGGAHDGALGVAAAVAAVRTLAGAGVRLRHPVEVLVFRSEEAVHGGGTFGSRAMCGLLDPALLLAPAAPGGTMADLLRQAGFDPNALAGAVRRPGSLAAFLELHVEQGAVLEAAGAAVGIVTAIVGIRRYRVSFSGQANHAGTTPMALRHDALVAAAPFILAVREAAVAEGGGAVATIGDLRVQPGAGNVIPGRVDLELEIRAGTEAALERLEAALRRAAAACGPHGWRPVSAKAPVVCHPAAVAAVEQATADLDLVGLPLASGAGHDAMCLAALAPTGMLFVPSRGGISHAPDERTDPAQQVAGARVLLGALLHLDETLDR